MGSSRFWFDNWTGLGILYFLVPPEFGINESIHNVYDVLEHGDWNINRLMDILPKEYALHIVEKIRPPVMEDVSDVPYCMLEARGHFSVNKTWEYVRMRNEPRVAYNMIWVWKAKLSLDDVLRRLGYFMPSKCWCCEKPKEESLVYMFFTSTTATTVWKYFLSRASIALSGMSMHHAITKCWTTQVIPRFKPIMQVLPSCIVWELWKRRNSLKYGDSVSKPGLKIPHKWQDLLPMMENYTPRLKYQKVIWEQPMESWLKVNTDGTSKGNPGRSAIGFCVTDEEGEIIYAVGREIAEGTNTKVEAIAIVESLKYCRWQNYTHIWLETDSLLLKNIIEGVWKPPWCIADQVEEILQLMEGFIFKVTHIYRERNKLADHLANYALEVGTIECHDFWQLDSQSRRLVNEDNM
ncbi:uncharacterized protein [Nicotiana tomentosiformis]|uniref:uncharacterized protein n=1 Tax=Nicotiana tomentosiformis TaxID=4098 RepID=UPI00051B2E5D